MNAIVLIVPAILLFVGGYVFYGRFVARRLGIQPERPTPAHTLRDGVDYMPTKPQILLGHHFSSIAGAAPIIGPITAAVFGWGPVYLWILLGGVLMGAVHDFSALVASVRHQGRSIGEVIEQRVGYSAKVLFLVFAWAALLLIIAVFVNAVALTFHKVPAAGTASSLLIGTAVLFGLAVYRLRAPFWVATLVGIGLIGVTLMVGHAYPLRLSVTTWKLILLGYIFIASVTPVWILLQPRDFLNSFLLYALLLAGVVGVFVANPSLQMKAFRGFSSDIGPLFPILFVTVACGALSGFHSLVASGTTAKQLDRESHAQPVAFGSMLIESLLAVVALITAAMLTAKSYHAQVGHGAVPIFARGVGGFVSTLGLSLAAGVTFASVAVAEFALTSLDTATRIARFALQELAEPKPRAEAPAATGSGDAAAPAETAWSRLLGNRFVATTVTVALGGAFALSGSERSIWPLFGAANQLLAALAFLAVLVWLTHRGIKRGFILVPTVLMFLVTLSALAYKTWSFAHQAKWVLASLALLLTVLSLVLLGSAIRVMRHAQAGDHGEREDAASPATPAA